MNSYPKQQPAPSTETEAERLERMQADWEDSPAGRYQAGLIEDDECDRANEAEYTDAY